MVTAYWYRNQFSELALFGVRVLSRLENDEAALLASRVKYAAEFKESLERLHEAVVALNKGAEQYIVGD